MGGSRLSGGQQSARLAVKIKTMTNAAPPVLIRVLIDFLSIWEHELITIAILLSNGPPVHRETAAATPGIASSAASVGLVLRFRSLLEQVKFLLCFFFLAQPLQNARAAIMGFGFFGIQA